MSRRSRLMRMWGVVASVCVAAAVIAVPGSTAIAQSQRFPDVPAGHYAFEAIEWAAEAGVTAGYNDGTFKPQQPLSKSHAVVFIQRYYDEILGAEQSEDFTRGDMMVLLKAINDGTLRTGAVTPQGSSAATGSQRFPDVPVDHYAFEAVEWAAEAGVTAGYNDGTFKPQQPLSKSHAVVFMQRYYDEILGAEQSEDFTRGDMMVLLKAINDGTLRNTGASPGEVSGVRVIWNESTEDLTVSWQEPANGGPVEGYAIDRAVVGSAFPDISSASGLRFADYSRYHLTTLYWHTLIDHGDGRFSYTLDEDVPQCEGTPLRCRYVGVIANLAQTAQVRVIAYNDAGFSVSSATDVPTQAVLDYRELQALTASWVQQYGAQISWLPEVWQYVTTRIADPRPSANPFDLKGFGFHDERGLTGFPGWASVGADCAHLGSPDRLCKSAGDGIADRRPFDLATTMHELGHIYTMSNDAPSNPLAIAAAYLYLENLLIAERSWTNGKLDATGHPCNVLELLATAAADMVMQSASGTDLASADASRHSSFAGKLRACDLRAAESRWQQEIAVVWSALNGTVPQWYYDTFRMANGEWDLDALWSFMSPLPDAYSYVYDRSGQLRLSGPKGFGDFVIYAFKDEFGGYCSDSVLSFHQYTLGGNPWRDGGCQPYDGPRELQSVQLSAGGSAVGEHGCFTADCKYLAIELIAPNGFYDVECWSSAGSEPFYSGQWFWPSSTLWTEGGCWSDPPGDGAVWVVVDGVTSNAWGQEASIEQPDPERFEAVSAGHGLHSCGLRTDGIVTCWGSNDEQETDAPSGTFSAVSAGGSAHSCGLRTDGTITCWGQDRYGQASAPSGAFSAVSAGGGHSCGLRTDGTVTCWGRNNWQQTDAPSGTFSAVSAGGGHSCGLRTDGTISCWGDNIWQEADAPSGTFSAVSAGGSAHSCGLRTDGTVTCWGLDYRGEVSAPSGTFSAVSAGTSHSCGLRTDGTVTCWGDNSAGQISDAPSGTFSAVSAGYYHSCGLRTDGTVTCWGLNNEGQADPP